MTVIVVAAHSSEYEFERTKQENVVNVYVSTSIFISWCLTMIIKLQALLGLKNLTKERNALKNKQICEEDIFNYDSWLSC